MKWKWICWILIVVVAAPSLAACGPGKGSKPATAPGSKQARFEQGSLSVIVGFRRAIDVLTGQKPAAEWEDLGTVIFMGREIPRAALLNRPWTR